MTSHNYSCPPAVVSNMTACINRCLPASPTTTTELSPVCPQLSMTHASDEVWQLAADISAHDHSEPVAAEPVIRPTRGDLGTPGVSLKNMTVKTKGGSARAGVGPGGDSPVAPEVSPCPSML